MSQSVFAAAILSVLTCLMYIGGEFRVYLARPEPYLEKISKLKEEVEKEKFERDLLEGQLLDFKLEVAKVLPEVLKGEKDYPLRNISSVVKPGETVGLDLARSKIVFNTIKENFSKKEYHQVIFKMGPFFEKYPFSPTIVEGYFLLMESHFQLRQFDDCIRVAEKMMVLFPESELTGFSLLRLGKVFEYQERADEAVEIYKTVLRSFPYRGVASQAQLSLRAVEL